MSLLRIGLVLLMLWNDGKRPEVSNNDSRFRVATYFYWRLKEARAESGPLLARKIREIVGDTPVICTGDFNSAPGSPQVTAVKEVLNDARDITQKPAEGVEETAFSGGVFQGAPKYRIDFIFLSRHFKVGDYKVLSDMYNGDRYPSDHLPVTSTIVF